MHFVSLKKIYNKYYYKRAFFYIAFQIIIEAVYVYEIPNILYKKLHYEVTIAIFLIIVASSRAYNV
jgi:hypothetical protein